MTYPARTPATALAALFLLACCQLSSYTSAQVRHSKAAGGGPKLDPWTARAQAVPVHIATLQDLPHVDECFFCHKCWLSKDKNPDALPTVHQRIGLEDDPDQGPAGAAKIVPTPAQWAAKRQKQNCSECWGCSTQLEPLKGQQAFGHNFAVEIGASPEWIFIADLPDTHTTGRRAIVKVFCLPMDKISGQFRPTKCDTADFSVRGAQHLVALDRLTAECGFEDITIRTWLAPVNAIMPGVGLHVFWYGLWMEKAPGLSLNQLAYIGRKDLVENMIIGLLQEKMNRTQVIRAAIYDLLTAQCDRHAQSLRFSWKHCSQDSIFLQGTQKNEIIRFGGTLVSKKLLAKPRRNLNPLILLDYRCYAPDGKIGTAFDPQLTQCLQKLASTPPAELKKEFGFTDSSTAEVAVTRAADLLSNGYEWTLKRGRPLNLAPMRYKWHKPCCELKLGPRGVIMCAHEWNVTAEFPIGDPLRGGPWLFTYPDPGAYDGSTLWT